MTDSAPRILIVGPSWVGDMVMAQSLFMALKQQAPTAVIDVLAPAWSRPILEAMPEVRAAIDMPVGHGKIQWGVRKALARTLKGQYDQAIVLPNSLKSALVPWMARIPRRTGWRGEMRYGLLNDVRILDKQRYPLMVQRFVALGLDAGAPPPSDCSAPRLTVAVEEAQAARKALVGEKSGNAPILALCPGAEFGAAKQWPEAHYAAVARSHTEQGGQVWLFGSEKDRPVCEGIVAQVPGKASVVNLAGRTSLAQAVALLSLADAVVSNDSGLMHVAAALHRPLVAVYGSTSPDFTPPLSEAIAIVRTGIDCSPCFKRECPLGHTRCLKDLPPDRVIAALRDLANSYPTRPVTPDVGSVQS